MEITHGDAHGHPPQPQSNERTEWGLVFLAIGAGYLAAVQVGKAYIALPSIRNTLAISLVDASWILSALSFVGLLIATPVGSIARRIGTKGTVTIGLLIMSGSSAIGGFAPTSGLLILSRVIEGLGFVMVVVGAPSLIVEVTERRHIRIALAAWATFMPGGVALATLLAPLLLSRYTWRPVWIVDAVLLALYALLLATREAHHLDAIGRIAEFHPFHDFWVVIRARGPVLLGIIFGLFTLQHLGIMGLMPTILIEQYRIIPSRVGVLVSIAMAANILGNLAAGLLLQKGVSRSFLIGGASIFMAVMTIGVFTLHLPFATTYLCYFLFSCVGGIVPGAVISAAPFHSPSDALVPATNGLLVQGSNLGIVFGPPLISSIAVHAGWKWVPALTLTAAFIATALAIIVDRSIHSSVKD